MAAICKDCPKLSTPKDGAEPVCCDAANVNYSRRRRQIVGCTRYRLHLHNYAKNNAEVRP